MSRSYVGGASRPGTAMEVELVLLVGDEIAIGFLYSFFLSLLLIFFIFILFLLTKPYLFSPFISRAQPEKCQDLTVWCMRPISGLTVNK